MGTPGRRVRSLTLASLTLLALLFASPLLAHGTLFGAAPRTMWKGGQELEAQLMWESMTDLRSGSSSAPNPTGLEHTEAMLILSTTYGITKDFALRGLFPFAWASESDNTGRDESFVGLKNWQLGVNYRLDPLLFGEALVFEGGSFPMATFHTLTVPTSRRRAGMELDGDDARLRHGLSASYSSNRSYLWMEASVDHSLSGEGEGTEFKLHISPAIRVINLKDYRDLDIIILVEFDYTTQAKATLPGGATDPNSGLDSFFVSLGTQANLTNLIELKLGYNVPIWRDVNGTQLVTNGQLAFSVNYLF